MNKQTIEHKNVFDVYTYKNIGYKLTIIIYGILLSFSIILMILNIVFLSKIKLFTNDNISIISLIFTIFIIILTCFWLIYNTSVNSSTLKKIKN